MTVIVVVFGKPRHKQDLGNTLIISSQSNPDYLDYAMSYQLVSWQLMTNAYNGLLTYRKEPGLAGSELVPDLAQAMPEISDDGTTYIFTIRRGISWGPPLNREVAPEDFKHAIQRAYDMASPGAGFFNIIEGADEFQAKSADTISGITTDDAAYTVTFQLTRPDATFLFVMAMPFSFPVPVEIPAEDQSNAGFIPPLGPYMFTEYTPGRLIRMERNPEFVEWSEHTPDGYVDAIEVRVGANPENSFTNIKRSKADYMFDPIPTSKMPMLLSDESLHEQFYIFETASLKYIFMNTQVPPFDNIKVRQAVNWAIDRRAMVKINGGRGMPTENVLPPLMPGYEKHDLYPEANLTHAKQLIAESGITPGKIAFWCSLTEPDPTAAQYMQEVLDSLGFTTEVRCIDRSAYFTTIGNAETKAPIGFGNWGQDFPEGSNFIDVLLNGARISPEHNNNYAQYTGSDEKIAQTMALTDQEERNRMWAEIDSDIMTDAAWAPYMAPLDYRFVSDRIGNYLYSPVYGLVFSRATVDGSWPDYDKATSGLASEGALEALTGNQAETEAGDS